MKIWLVAMSKSMLVFLNYTRTIPPFMITELELASSEFNIIYYVTPELFNDNSAVVKYDNVKIIQVPRKYWYLSFIKLPAMLLRRESIENVFRPNLTILKPSFIKHHIVHIICSETLKTKVKEIIDNSSRGFNDIYVMAVWFSIEAYAVAQLKKKYSRIKAVSLAHSFEVDPLRNSFIDQSFNKFKHRYLDNINFISSKVYEQYNRLVMKKFNLNDINISFIHLGSKKYFKDMNNPSRDGVFRIWTCSSVYPVKRLHLVIEVLEKWNLGKIEWTHIGSGPLLKILKREAQFLISNNRFISIKFVGELENIEVHKYYVNNPCDIFINVSISEGLPVSIMESMSYGVPVIATDVGGNREIVNDKSGFLLPADFLISQFYQVLKSYYELDKNQRAIYRENAFRRWAENFNSKDNMLKYFNEIRQL